MKSTTVINWRREGEKKHYIFIQLLSIVKKKQQLEFNSMLGFQIDMIEDICSKNEWLLMLQIKESLINI
jgi:hypothetical protein